MSERKCSDVVIPFVEAAYQEVGFPKFQIIGGNGSAALTSDESIIDVYSDMIIARPDSDIPLQRDDGTLRDADILVLSNDPEEIAEVEALANEVIGDELIVSVFGLKSVADLEAQRLHPVISSSYRVLGDRYVDTSIVDDELQIDLGFKAIYPFAAPITTETLDSYSLLMEGKGSHQYPVPTAHPGATLLNYLTRSISGLRPKDQEKVARLSDTVLGLFEIPEWVHDGPGATTLELARILHTLREPKKDPETLRIGEHLQIVPLSTDELYEHRFFMDKGYSDRQRRALIEVARMKARIIHTGESQQQIVTWWQQNVEQRIHKIVHND